MLTLARRYSDAPDLDSRLVGLWHECAEHTDGIRLPWSVHYVEFHPYDSAAKLAAAIARGAFLVSGISAEHPVWTVQQNLRFRAVHDALGHADGAPFDFEGERQAYFSQRRHYPRRFWPVLFTEIVAQAAHYLTYRTFGTQKIAYMGGDYTW